MVEASGVTPVEFYSGWETRGWTSSNGVAFQPGCVVWHHTWLPVPFPTSVLANGRTDVPGPLCHLNVKPDRLVVIAGEGANHGGIAVESVYRDALNGIAHDLTAAQRGLGEGSEAWHEFAFGVEVDWAGDAGDPLTDWQDDCIKKLMVAWNKVQGLVPGNHITHAETTSRKWDPGFTHSIWKPYRTWLKEHLEDDVALTPFQQQFLDGVESRQVSASQLDTLVKNLIEAKVDATGSAIAAWLKGFAQGINITSAAAAKKVLEPVDQGARTLADDAADAADAAGAVAEKTRVGHNTHTHGAHKHIHTPPLGTTQYIDHTHGNESHTHNPPDQV